MKRLICFVLFLLYAVMSCHANYNTVLSDTVNYELTEIDAGLFFITPQPNLVIYSNIHGVAEIGYEINPLVSVYDYYYATIKNNQGYYSAYQNVRGEFQVTKAGVYSMQPSCYILSDLLGRRGWVYGAWINISVVDNNPPARPTGLTIVRSAASHPFLTWNKNTEKDIDHYDIYKMNPRNSQFEKTGTTYNNYYEDLSEIVSYGENRENEGIISYRVIAYDINGNFSAMSEDAWVYIYIPDLIKAGEISAKEEISCYGLEQNYPNPFNPVTQINYQIKSRGMVILNVYDMLGKEVVRLVNEIQEPGRYSVQFDASDFPSGTYLYSLRVNDFIQNSKMVLLK